MLILVYFIIFNHSVDIEIVKLSIIKSHSQRRSFQCFVFSTFVMVPKHIYLKKVQHKHFLNSMRLVLFMFSNGDDRIIAEQRNSFVGLSLNWYVITQIVIFSHFHQSQYFILRHFFGEKTGRLEKAAKFFTLWHWRNIKNFARVWYPSCKSLSNMRL